jgi:lipopolysaccharide export system permease protein
MFILIMQFVWKYIDDLVGKGLEWTLIAELLWYTSASLVPMAIPLAILLSSIMTFGNFGEHYELVALKSAGLSLHKIMRPLVVLSIVLSIAAFYFSNNILPVANLKMGALLWDITQQKPSLNLKPGIFYNGIEGYSIKVDHKDNETGLLEGILIYDHSSRMGASQVVTARTGMMATTEDDRYMILTLNDGTSYEEVEAYPFKKNNAMPHRRIKFQRQVITFDMSSFKLERTDEDLFKDHQQMLTLNQLVAAEDTLEKRLGERIEMINSSVRSRYFFGTHLDTVVLDTGNIEEDIAQLLDEDGKFQGIPFSYSKEERLRIIANASKIARHNKAYVTVSRKDLEQKRSLIIKHRVEWHRKFTLSFACLLLFFVGAPLGAIIRKGGLGLPGVIAVGFFLIFHLLSIFGEKTAKAGVIEPYVGMWMASAFFLPLGIFLTHKASTDSSLFDVNTFLDKLMFWKKADSTENE